MSAEPRQDIPLDAIDAFAKSRSITRSKAIQMACAQFIETGAADPLEERFAALEARVKALEEGK